MTILRSMGGLLFLVVLASSAVWGQDNMPGSSQPAPALPAPERLPPPAVEGDGRLALDDVLQMALANHPGLAEAAARVRAARWEQLQVGLPPNMRLSYLASEVGNDGRQGQQGGQVAQEFVTGHKLQLSRAVAEREIAVRQQQFATQRQRVMTDTSLAFYQVLVLQRRIELVEGLLTTSQRAVEAAQRLFDAAETRKTDLLQAQIEGQRARIDLIQAQAAHAAAWRNLAAVIGMPGLPPRPLYGSTDFDQPRMSWEDALERVLSGHPQVGAALAGVERASAQVRREQAQRIPNIDASLALQHDNATRDDIAGVQVEVPLPLWNRNQGGINRARADLTAARRAVNVVELQLTQRLAEVFQQYETAFQQVERYGEQVLPLAQQTLELVGKGYEQGEVSYLDLLTAQRTYFQVNLEYLDSLGELWSSLQRIEGLLLDGSLQARDW
ncbi:MAG: TolC family protein [Pirellulaceae bacterium]|nr:TolC family protein [Pirellulaceae bacterium]